MEYAKFAVIPTHNRPNELNICIEAIRPQVEMVFVIDNASEPPVNTKNATVIRFPEQPPNLSRIWNIGLTAAEMYAQELGVDTWDTAILNDDAIPYPGWMALVCDGIRSTTALAGCTMPGLGAQVVWGPETGPGIGTRVTGWAFVLRGEAFLRFDERLQWWAGDDDISMVARKNGGLVMVPGAEVPNTLANTSTAGELLVQSAKDMQTFVDKWGQRPW